MMSNLSKLKSIKSRSVSPENFTAEKGKGGMATEGTSSHHARELGVGWKMSPAVIIKAKETFCIADIKDIEGAIKHIWMVDNSPLNRTLILRGYWDGSDIPSIETPLGDFFASADYQDYRQLSSLAVCVNPKRAFNCYWEMPFKKGFKFTVENVSEIDIMLYYQIDFEEKEMPEDMGYFHAQFRRVNPVPYKEVYTILDNIKGKGHYVGTYMFWSVKSNGWWGEGEIKFYLDGDKEYPTICGTGTEDYFCGSYNFDVNGRYVEYTTPYAGLSKVIKPDGLYIAQQKFSLYRWHITDPIYFENDIKVTIQALGWRSFERYCPLQDDISSVAFWYQDSICTTFPTLPDKDYLEIV